MQHRTQARNSSFCLSFVCLPIVYLSAVNGNMFVIGVSGESVSSSSVTFFSVSGVSVRGISVSGVFVTFSVSVSFSIYIVSVNDAVDLSVVYPSIVHLSLIYLSVVYLSAVYLSMVYLSVLGDKYFCQSCFGQRCVRKNTMQYACSSCS